ncbi:MAG: peroxiredoxin family protein [Armatimonadota bacterium]
MSLRKHLIWLALALTLVMMVIAPPVSAAVKVGDKAPDFQLRTVDGKGTVKLSTYFGKPTLLVYWASWCPHCRTELPVLQKVYNELHPRGMEAVGVSLDHATNDALKFVTQKSITFPVGYGGTDQGYKIAESYGVSGIPMTFVLDKNGVVKAVFRGDAGERAIRAEFEKLGVK